MSIAASQPPLLPVDGAALRNEVLQRGFALLPGALSAAAVAGFVSQLSASLPRGLSLTDASTWPRGGARRVIEVAPLGAGEHWRALTASPRLCAALDALLGARCWALPLNAGDTATGALAGPRHWYAPVVFSEAGSVQSGEGQPDR